MKKTFAFLLVFFVLLSFAACSPKENNAKTEGNETKTEDVGTNSGTGESANGSETETEDSSSKGPIFINPSEDSSDSGSDSSSDSGSGSESDSGTESDSGSALPITPGGEPLTTPIVPLKPKD